ncbi:tail length tape measure protein [Gordonia phage Chikenjars]|uniref:Tape measure protein n=1 Tax=Gordonia phage Chikenjars TaxID=2601686 RepID=A0A5J6D9Z4_9CAUD|nr:tail length tape measure protein [Gordonia phage Chikenjars]QEQ94335.1 tape measure protein [Gordonia phage Chikenjars]
MAVIDDLIVAMQFDNSKFEAAVKVSMATLTHLKSTLNFGAGPNGIDAAQASANRFNTNQAQGQVGALSAKFTAMATVAITAISNITNKIVDAGVNMAKALTIDPITSGLQEYETNMNSIQTILANTEASGATLKDVSANLDELNHYADQTIYNFSEMAKNIGTFTAAGVDLDTSTQSIKGIANLAALSGSNSQQASTAMYQLSQAISSGRVSLEDWNSVVNAGMGGTVFQRALAQTAEKMGTLSSGAVELTGDMKNVSIEGKSFRESITAKPGQESWLTSEVLTNTLKQFTGDLSDAELAAQGFSAAQIKAIQQQAKTAKAAATEVKTFTQLIDTLKEGVGSSWAESWRTIIGDFEQAKSLWTGVSNTVGDMIGKSSDARNELLKGWAEGGGRVAVIEGLSNAFKALMSIINPIKDAFREIFPPATAANLISLSQAFARFTEGLIVGSETADRLKRTFAGVFAIFGIAATVIKAVIGVFFDLFGAAQGGSGGILSITASLGDFLVKVHETLANSEGFKNFFEGLGTILAVPIKLFGVIGEGISAFLTNLGQIGGALSQVYAILSRGDFISGPFSEDSKIVDILFRMREGLEYVTGAISQFWNALTKGDAGAGPFSPDSALMTGLEGFSEMLGNFFTPGNISTLLGAGAVAALGYGFIRVFKAAVAKLTGEKGGIIGDLKDTITSIKDSFESVTGIFDKLTSSLTVMQANIKSDIILKIAVAVGILALAMKLLATMDVPALVKSLTAVTVAVGILVGALAVISKLAGAAGIVQMPVIAAGLVLLAAAVLVLSAAVKVMATMSWEELAKGLTGVVALIGMLVAASYGLGKASGPMLRAGLAMIPMAAGIRLLVLSVQAMSTFSWAELGKGLGGLAAMMLILAGSLNLMPKNMPFIGAGLLLVGGALLVISSAIGNLGSMDTGALVQGILGIGGALAIVALALNLMPKNMLMMSAGLMIVSIALVAIGGVIQSLGGMSVGELAKGLIGLGVSLGMLAIALIAMQGAMMGALALGIAAAGLTLLMIPISMMASMSWGELLMGLGGLAAILVLLGVAGYVLGPVTPVIIALGIGMAALGIGMLAVAAAALVFGLALKTMFEVVMLGQGAMTAVLTFIPQLATAFALAVASFAVGIAQNAGAIVGALGELLSKILDMVIQLIPKIATVISELLTAVLNIIIEHAPQVADAFIALVRGLIDVVTTLAPELFDAGFQLIIGFLTVIRDRIPEVANLATDIIVTFIGTLASNINRIIQAGVDFIVDFLNGLAQGIRDNMPRVTAAATEVGKALVEGIANAIRNGLSTVISAAKDLASSALTAAKEALGIASPSKRFYELGEWTVEGYVNGIESKDSLAAKTANKFATGFVAGFSKGIGKEMPAVLDEVFKIIEEGTEDAVISTQAMEGGFSSLSGAVWQAELALAEFHGEVNRADPKSVEAYVEKAGGKLKYLAGVLDAVKEAANEAFSQLAEGKGLDQVLGSEEFLGTILNTGLSVGSMFGIEGMLITAGIRLGLAVVDGLLSVFMGPGTTVLGLIGGWIQKLVKAVGGWFGIKFPVAEELEEGDKALEDFMAKVDEGNGRYEKLTEEAVKGLTDRMNEADDLANGIDGTEPVIRPILDLNGWNKQFEDFLDSLDTGPVVLNAIINRASDFFDDTVENLRNLFNFDRDSAAKTTIIEMNQTNTSPKALDHVEIYRNTKSQLSLAKEELGIT